jgi:hypothetical protein
MKGLFLLLPLLPAKRPTASKPKGTTGRYREAMTGPDTAVVHLREINTQVKIGVIAMLLLARR